MSHPTHCHHCGALQKDANVTVRFKGVDSKCWVIYAVLSEGKVVMMQSGGTVSDITETADSDDAMPFKFALEDLLKSQASQERIAHLLGALLRHYMGRFEWQELTAAEISPFMAEA